jgi:hypothetical protein
LSSIIQRSFAGGELAPALQARADQTKYQTGLKTCRNFMVMRHGGVTNRPGTEIVGELKNSLVRGRLQKFVFNADQTYVLVFGERHVRFVQDGAFLIVNGAQAYVAGQTYPQASVVSFSGLYYYAMAATAAQPTDTATWYALMGGVYEIPTPYAAADIPRVKRDQSGDVVTLTHPNYPIMELRRFAVTTWTLTPLSTAPSIDPPTGVTNDQPGNNGYAYLVTSVKADSLEESIGSSGTQANVASSPDAVVKINWTAVSGAESYNIYRSLNGVFGFIGTSNSTSFDDTGIPPDPTVTPPRSRTPFVAPGDYPSTSTYWQQRHVFADTANAPEKFWTSRSANFRNFSISVPLQDDDAVTGTVAGSEVQEIRHMLSLGQFVVLTAGGEWVIKGDADGVLRPAAINPTQYGYNGASWVTPAIVNDTAIYIQARGSVVRDLRYALETNGYSGRDLSVFSTHLFQGHTIEFMDYAQVPNSIVWLIRSDGVLLGLTYMREHEIWGWHRHDTDGVFEDVCCVPEGNEDAVYVIVRRTINGVTKRFVERFYSRLITDLVTDAHFVDCGATYDGRNTSSMTMTLSNGVVWNHTELLPLTASSSIFTASDVGNKIVLTSGVETIELSIVEYANPQVVNVRSNKIIPAAFRGIATASWSRAVDQLTGLSYLEGKAVSVLADGNVISNGFDDPLYVTGGIVTLSEPYSVIHVGLPYVSDFETLDLEVIGQETISDKEKLIKSVTLTVEDSRSFFAGPDFDSVDEDPVEDVPKWSDHLTEAAQRQFEDWGEVVRLFTGKIEVKTLANWNESGRVCVRQRDPLPLTILGVTPNGEVGG